MSSVHPASRLGVGTAYDDGKQISRSAQPVARDAASIGTDLSGHVHAPVHHVWTGANMTFATRFFGDLSYRYGRVRRD